jgi:AbrB family looped-hinge helix DNA binding protein
MNTIITVDKAGRVILPKSVRDKLRLGAGDSLEMESTGEEIVLRPRRESAQMRKRDGIWVFRRRQPISLESVNEAIRQLREERDGSRPESIEPHRHRKSR